ncbi:unnamed protein product [Strongylus vulgaris]|uniref:Uncharacterized protein n=1 Tax=Strongylus vulgaris TaxID=40348 RepID=A0A3P7L8J3_STRVU|nr:unnamed protein product [Strongylus vulgaris]
MIFTRAFFPLAYNLSAYIQVGGYHGDTMVKCLTTHLSVFSVGLFDANVDTDFTYEYIADHREEHIAATMIVIVMTVHMLIVMLFAINYEMIEGDKLYPDGKRKNKDMDRAEELKGTPE